MTSRGRHAARAAPRARRGAGVVPNEHGLIDSFDEALACCRLIGPDRSQERHPSTGWRAVPALNPHASAHNSWAPWALDGRSWAIASAHDVPECPRPLESPSRGQRPEFDSRRLHSEAPGISGASSLCAQRAHDPGPKRGRRSAGGASGPRHPQRFLARSATRGGPRRSSGVLSARSARVPRCALPRPPVAAKDADLQEPRISGALVSRRRGSSPSAPH